MDRRSTPNLFAHRSPAALALAVLLALGLGGCTVPGSPSALPTTTPVAIAPTATTPPSPTAAPSPTPQRDQTPQEIYRRVGPAVVTIVNYGSQGGRRNVGFGSGVIFDRRGFIATNNHVVAGQRRLEVIFSDGTTRDAQLVGADPATDLAVVKVDGDLPGAAQFGDSSKLEPGQSVVAIGSALGEFTNTVTTGIVSGLHRDLPEQEGVTLEDMIQTDAAINPGNSGGPLLNLQGQVIGINTVVIRRSGQSPNSSAPTEGLGFAIPSNVARIVGERLIADGRIARPDPGVMTEMVTPGLVAEKDLQVQQGALVVGVVRGGPAETAGIQVDDVIVAVDGKRVSRDSTLSFLLLAYKPGDQVAVTIARGQDRINFPVTLAEAVR